MLGKKFNKEAVPHSHVLLRGSIGLGLLLGWYYCFYYACVLIWTPETSRVSELIWAITMSASFVACIALYAMIRKGKGVGEVRTLSIGAASCQATATILVFLAYLFAPIEYGLMIVGSILAGIAIPVLFLLWLEVLKFFKDSVIEFSVPASFLVALLLYTPLVTFKNSITVIIIAALPLLSAIILLGMFNAKASSCKFLCGHKFESSQKTISEEISRSVVDARLSLSFRFLEVTKTAILFLFFGLRLWPSERVLHPFTLTTGLIII